MVRKDAVWVFWGRGADFRIVIKELKVIDI